MTCAPQQFPIKNDSRDQLPPPLTLISSSNTKRTSKSLGRIRERNQRIGTKDVPFNERKQPPDRARKQEHHAKPTSLVRAPAAEFERQARIRREKDLGDQINDRNHEEKEKEKGGDEKRGGPSLKVVPFFSTWSSPSRPSQRLTWLTSLSLSLSLRLCPQLKRESREIRERKSEREVGGWGALMAGDGPQLGTRPKSFFIILQNTPQNSSPES